MMGAGVTKIPGVTVAGDGFAGIAAAKLPGSPADRTRRLTVSSRCTLDLTSQRGACEMPVPVRPGSPGMEA